MKNLVVVTAYVAVCLPFMPSSGFSQSTLSQQEVQKGSAARIAGMRDLQSTPDQASAGLTYRLMIVPTGVIPGLTFDVPVSHIMYEKRPFFEFDKDVVDAAGQSLIAEFASRLKKDITLRSVFVVGHTDSIGSDEYNYQLSLRRASAVAWELVRAGVPLEYLRVVPMGEAQPAESNETEAGRARNRRVEFFLSSVPKATEEGLSRRDFDPCHRNNHPPQLDPRPSRPCVTDRTSIQVLRPVARGQPLVEDRVINLAMRPVSPIPFVDNTRPVIVPGPAERTQIPIRPSQGNTGEDRMQVPLKVQ